MSDPLRTLAGEWPRLTLEERAYEPGDVGAATLVVAATDARSVNAQVAADAQRAGRLVNVVDVPDEGNCTAVAAHRAGSLVIGVSAGGVPAAAARVRDAIAARFDDRFGKAVAALATVRRGLIDSGRSAAWQALERQVVGAEFCAHVEDATFDARLADRKREVESVSEGVACR